MPLRSRVRRAILTGGLSLLLPRRGEAHAILEASIPVSGAKVPAGPVALTLRYNVRIDRPRSGLTLIRPDRVRTAIAIDPEGPPDILTATVTLEPGDYTVRWQVLGVDGHITRGDVTFTVAKP